MLDLRLKGLKLFRRKPVPGWGADLTGIDFENIKYFVRSTEKQAASWDDLPADIKSTYDRLGIPQAERQRLIVGVAAQYESEVVYHKIREDLEARVAAAVGVPAGTARGWLRRLRANAGQLRAHAIGELSGLGFYPPGPPSEPAGPPLGDALNALAAAVDCARRNLGHGPQMTWPLAGRLGLARYLMPAPAG